MPRMQKQLFALSFGLAALISGGICRWQGLGLRFAPALHGHLFGFGASMFGVGYLFVYYAERHVASGPIRKGNSLRQDDQPPRAAAISFCACSTMDAPISCV